MQRRAEQQCRGLGVGTDGKHHLPAFSNLKTGFSVNQLIKIFRGLMNRIGFQSFLSQLKQMTEITLFSKLLQ